MYGIRSIFSESIISNYIQDLNKIESCKLLRNALYEGEYLLDFYYCEKGYGAVLIRKEVQTTYFSEILDIDEMMKDFVEKIEPYLIDFKYLYICPDGDLYNISFARYIDTEISYLSSPQDLLEDYKQSRGDANHDNFLDIISPKIFHISTHGEYVDLDQLMENGRLYLSGYNKTDSGY